MADAVQAAMRAHKPLVCLVGDGWPVQLAAEPAVAELLAAEAVVLPLAEGSLEYNQLASLVPLAAPSLLVLGAGSISMRLTEPISAPEFVVRWRSQAAPAEKRAQTETQGQAQAPQTQGQAQAPQKQAQTETQAQTPSQTLSQSEAQSQAQSQPQAQSQAQAQTAPPAQSQAQAQPQSHSQAQSQARTQAKAQPQGQPNTQPQAQPQTQPQTQPQKGSPNWTASPKARIKETQEERDRIRLLVEQDKRNRQADRNKTTGNTRPEPTGSRTGARTDPRISQHASLAIRNFDGNVLKHQFAAAENLADVRIWLAANVDRPYQFAQAYPPRTFAPPQESKTLAELGLTPSAALVLKPCERQATGWGEWIQSWWK